jgi:hypothetical protein
MKHCLEHPSNHLPEKDVQFIFSVSKVATSDEVVGLLSPPTGRVVQLERPQKVSSLLEVRSNGEDFVNQVFRADDVEFSCTKINNIKPQIHK